jgi:hypothetical protein
MMVRELLMLVALSAVLALVFYFLFTLVVGLPG